MNKVVLAGFGVMGKYYAEKLAHHADEWGVELAGIVDLDSRAYDLSTTDGRVRDIPLLQKILDTTTRYDNIDAALVASKADIVINVASSYAHIDIIRALERHPSVRAFLTEKPLVESPQDQGEAADRLRKYFVSMNMITNFSKAAQQFQNWTELEAKPLVGIDAVWGKDRRNDKRPTPGIASDIVHPVGLIQSIFNVSQWSMRGKAQGLYGNLSTDRDGKELNCVFHYSAKFATDVAPIWFDCSYAWKEQQRRITAFFRDGKRYVGYELFLDDLANNGRRGDYVRVSEIPADFSRPTVIDITQHTHDDKLKMYLERSFAAFGQGNKPSAAGLIGLDEEQNLGKIFGMLHPSDDRDILMKSPDIAISDADPDAPHTPRHPVFPTIKDSTPEQLRWRIERFRRKHLPVTPVASFEEIYSDRHP